jgi:hypothetical protein
MNFLYTIYKKKEHIIYLFLVVKKAAKNYTVEAPSNIQPSDSREGKTKTTKNKNSIQ